MARNNVIRMNTLHLNSVRLNGIGEVQSVSLSAGTDPEQPPVTPPTYTLAASVNNGVVTATRNGVAVALPYVANEGDTIVLSVTPNDGYAFEGWADGNTDNPRTIMMQSDVTLSAECVAVVAPSKYIQFEDPAVEAICVANWSSDGIGLTMEDAAKVTDMSNTFQNNTDITSFNELVHFVNLQSLGTRTDAPSLYGTFLGCTNLKSVKIPPSVKTLGSFAFKNCSSLEEVGDLSGVEIMGTQVFYNCAKLAITIYMPYLVSIKAQATFYGSSITGVDSLGTDGSVNFGGSWNQGVFQNCKAMKYVNIPSSVTTISGYDFQGCTSLEKLILRGATPPTLGSASALSQTNNCPIYVPDASLEAYKTAVNWVSYADRIHPLSEIEGGVVIEMGYKLNTDGSISQSSTYAVVGTIPIAGGEYVKWGNTIGTLGLLVEYNENLNKVDYWNGESTARTIRTKTTTRFIKACFPASDIDNSYIYDETNGKYLWKGKNVE
jgi:hypothetical protein